MDKATQMTLGLNHGLPAWYKRAHGCAIRPEGQAGSPHQGAQTAAGGSGAGGSGSWRREYSSGIPIRVRHGMAGSPRKF